MHYRGEYTPAAYGADFARNLRWGYHTRYGRGRYLDPYRGGGSYGRGYGRAASGGFHAARPLPRGPWRRPYEREPRRPRFRRGRTAARRYDEAYPYFGSAAAVEGAQGYPPGNSLNPDVYGAGFGPNRSYYDDEY
ncbi:MAG TPA: hypothetical protein VF188_14655 [Longimicrobiales bacterium]